MLKVLKVILLVKKLTTKGPFGSRVLEERGGKGRGDF